MGGGWGCSHADRTVTCSWDGPLAADDTTTPVTIVTNVTDPQNSRIVNDATVTSTGTETTTGNNDDADVEVPGAERPTGSGTLPRTGAAISGLVLLGLMAGGRLLSGRRRDED